MKIHSIFSQYSAIIDILLKFQRWFKRYCFIQLKLYLSRMSSNLFEEQLTHDQDSSLHRRNQGQSFPIHQDISPRTIEFDSSNFYRQKGQAAQSIQMQQLKEANKKRKQIAKEKGKEVDDIQQIIIPKRIFAKRFILPDNFQNQLEENLYNIVMPQIKNYFNFQVDKLFETQNDPENEDFKPLIGHLLFSHAFSTINEVYYKFKDLFPNFNSQRLKEIQCILAKIVENVFYEFTKQLQEKYKMSGDKDCLITFEKNNKPLQIQRTRNEEYDIFIRDDILYPKVQDSQGLRYLFKIINHILKISKSTSLYKLFQQLTIHINHHKNSTDYSSTCKQIRKGLAKQLLNADKVKMGKKISNESLQYLKETDFQVKDKSFNSLKELALKSSAIVRILTKFIETNEELIEQPQFFISWNKYPFKDIDNNIVFLDEQQRKQLHDSVKKLQNDQNLKKHKKELFDKQVEIIFDQKEKHLNKFVIDKQLALSEEILEALVQTTIKYSCLLIELLIKAGNIKNKHNKDLHINLVNFNIRDLFRATIKCKTQQQFKNVLGIVNELDRPNLNGSFKEQTLFKAIKLSNKIQNQNTVLLNFLLRREKSDNTSEANQVTCEIQIKLLQDRTGQQGKSHLKLYNYSHCLYEFNRGKLGVISEIATVIKTHSEIFKFVFVDSQKQQKKSVASEITQIYTEKFVKLNASGTLTQESWKDMISKESKDIEERINKIIERTGQNSIHQEALNLIHLKQNIKAEAHWITFKLGKPKDKPTYQKEQVLEVFPKSDYSFVKTFHLSNQKNIDLSKINKFINISYLVLRSCEIKQIKALNYLLLTHKLKKLILPGNQLSNISQFQQNTCFNLQTLDISNNNFDPQSPIEFQIDFFPELKQLDLSQNALTSLTITKKSSNTTVIIAVEDDEQKRIEDLVVVVSQSRKAKRQLKDLKI